MKKLLSLFGTVLALGFFYFSLQAQEGFKTLNAIAVNGDVITMSLSGETKFNVFKISNPPRLVVEFTNTEHNIKNKEIEVKGKYIKRIRSGQFENEPEKIARVVVDLNVMTEYDLTGRGNDVVLSLNPEGKSAQDAAVAAKQDDTTVVAVPVEETKEAQAIPAAPAAPKAAQQAAAPVKKKPAPVTAKKTPTKPKKVVLPKAPVTLDFEEADIKDVLRILSIKSGINIIHGDEVTGAITLHLENVPFDKAFDTILSLKGLVSQEQGANIVRITTVQKVTEERMQAVTFTRIFPLNYAKADEVKPNLDTIRLAEGRRGSVSIDARTNSLIVTDTPEGLAAIETVLTDLDRKPYQVIIEAKIVEVVLTDDLDLGIEWSMASNPGVIGGGDTAIGSIKAEDGKSYWGLNPPPKEDLSGPQAYTVNNVQSGGTGVSFPAAAVGGQISSLVFSVLTGQSQVDVMLTALAQKGLSKLLSTPRVTTINNKQAKILIGQRIPYTTTTVSAAGSTQATQFLDVGIKLTVTPTINADQKITLAVHPEVSLFIRADAAGPVLGTREADTTVMVNNGETVVIGGLITEEDRKLGTQVPLLGDLPIIGHLFKRDYSSKQRTELLVFLTPQIIEN